MPLCLHELVNDEEFRPVVDVENEAYSNPFNGVWEITKGASLEECCARQLSWHRNDPSSHWLYVTDDETGAVVGGAQWNVHRTNPFAVEKPTKTAYWLPEGPKKEIGNQLYRGVTAQRPARMSKPHLLLNYLFVHPAHRNRGAANLMMKWGTEKADELGLDAFVESTEIARRTYEKHGFSVVEELNLDPQLDDPSVEFIDLRKALGCPIHGWVMKREGHSSP